jgi:hypothetical protein
MLVRFASHRFLRVNAYAFRTVGLFSMFFIPIELHMNEATLVSLFIK